ncbi:signal peptidase I [Enterococcus sp. LJL51]|uniref:signal peptidase I n=1 Tax=Enterococcus sp. LJL51 TaxID=3416656 RepID=UPI003CEB9E61
MVNKEKKIYSQKSKKKIKTNHKKELVKKKRHKNFKSLNKKKLKRKKRKKSQKIRFLIKNLLIEIGVTMTLVSLFLYILSLFLFSIQKIDNYSMFPTLQVGNHVFVAKQSLIKHLDLVCLKRKKSGKIEIRRVVGVPGDKIEYENDTLFVNGESKLEPFLQFEKEEAKRNGGVYTADFQLLKIIGEVKIPEGKYFLLGDNRPYTHDSRDYGVIDHSEIIGVVKFVF